MAGRDGQGEVFSPGSRKRDRTVEDALKTLERLAQWLEVAREEDVWRQMDDPLQVAMLHGMLLHVQQEIEQVLALGGEQVGETVRALRTLAAQEDSDSWELEGTPGNSPTSAAQGGKAAYG